MRVSPLGAIRAIGAFALLASQQASPAAALSPAMRTHLQSEQLQIVTSIRGLPLDVRERMQEMFGSSTSTSPILAQSSDGMTRPAAPCPRSGD